MCVLVYRVVKVISKNLTEDESVKILIITDLEGPAGVNGRSDGIGNKIINLPAATAALTAEVNACVEGLIESGAKEIVVVDGHGGSNSIEIQSLHPMASLHTLGGVMAPANIVDASYDAVIQLGAHAMQGVSDGYLNHTFNSHAVAAMRVNGELIGEIGVCGLYCGYFNVPTILVSGDQAACREAIEFFGKSVCTVPTKQATARYTVINRPLGLLYPEMKKVAAAALKKFSQDASKFPIKKILAPYTMEVQNMCPNIADAMEKIGAERVDYQTIAFHSDDFIDLWAQRNGWASGVHNRRFNVHPNLNKKQES